MLLNNLSRGSGPPVVLIHGLFGMSRNFGSLQKALAGSYHTITVDVRNHGNSPHASGMRYTDLAADVLETLDALGLQSAAWIGHSMGGKIAMTAAIIAPAKVNRLLVADIAPVSYSHRNERFIQAMRQIPLNSTLTRHTVEHLLFDTTKDESIAIFLAQNMTFTPAPSWRIGLDAIADGIRDLEGWNPPPGTFDGPTLFVRGEASNFVADDDRAAIRTLFPAAKIVTLKGAGHWLHADNPSGFLSVARTFLDQTSRL